MPNSAAMNSLTALPPPISSTGCAPTVEALTAIIKNGKPFQRGEFFQMLRDDRNRVHMKCIAIGQLDNIDGTNLQQLVEQRSSLPLGHVESGKIAQQPHSFGRSRFEVICGHRANRIRSIWRAR